MHCKRPALLLVTLFGVLWAACHVTPSSIGNPAVPPPPADAMKAEPAKEYDYTHRVISDDGPKVVKRRIAVARFDDRFGVEQSPFGKVDLSSEFWRYPGEPSQVAPKRSQVPDRFTEMVVHEMVESKYFVVIERRDINAILRELTFSESRWMAPKDKQQAALSRVEWIVTGSFGFNREAETVKQHPLSAFFRAYSVATGEVVASSRVVGNNVYSLVKSGVQRIVETAPFEKIESKPSK